MSKAGITVAIKGEINDLEVKITQSKEIINEATKQIIAENNKLKASQDAITNAQKTYANEIANAKDEIKKYIEIKSQNGKLTKDEQKNLAAAKAELALYKIKTSELVDVEKQRQQEIRKTINASKELSNLQRASIADSRLEIDTKRKIIAAENEVAKSKDNSEKSTSNLANTTIRYLRWAGTIAGVVYAGKRAWDLTAGSGIAVNKIIENNTYGIAALISANTQMVDSLGKTLSPIEKFTMGQTHAKKVIAELRTESTKTAATFPQLLEIFQQGIGKTLAMGDAFGSTTEEIEKNTIKLASRMSNFANAIGMPMDRVKEEMRSLVSGNASTDSLIATIIFGSPGEANKAIKEAETKVNGVADLLNKKFTPFDILAETKTFDKSVLAIQDAWSRAMGDMIEKSGAFKEITNVFYEMSNDITTNTDNIVKSFDSIYQTSKTIVSVLDEIAIAGAIFFIGGKLDSGLSSVATLIKNSEIAAVGLEATVLRLALGAEALKIAFLGLIAANPFTALAVAGTVGFEIFSKINDEIIKMQHGGKTQEEFNKQIKEQESAWSSLDETHARITKNIEERTKRQQALQKAVGIYESQGLDASKLKTELNKVTEDLDNYKTALDSINPYKDAAKQMAKFNSDQKQAGELIANIRIDTERIKEDEKEILKTKGNTAEWEAEIAKYQKNKAESVTKLQKAEEAQTQATKINGEANKVIATDIAALKKDIANQDLLISLKQSKINEENQKDADTAFKKAETLLNKKKEQNKQDSENKAVLLELSMLQSGQIDEERLKISLSQLAIQTKQEEAKYLQEGLDKNKLLVEIEKEKLNLKKLQTEEEVKKQKQYKFDQISGAVKYSGMENLGQIYQELLVYYKEDPESLADLQTWVEREQNKLSKKPLVIDIKLQGWDEVSNSIATFGNSFQDINKAQHKYQQENEKVIKDEVALNQARVDLRDTTMSGIADMTGAVASFYDKDDDRRKKQLELQKVFFGAKMAMQIAELAQSTAFTSLFIAQETAKGATAGATAVAVAAQSSPWTGLATAAAMAALLASVGIMIGGSTKTTTTISSDKISSQLANTGTGTVLGDTSAQSESISESLSILEEYAKPEFRLSQQMAASLQSIDQKMGGVSSLLVRTGGFAFGEGFTPKNIDTGWTGVGVSVQNVANKGIVKIEDLLNSVLPAQTGGLATLGLKSISKVVGSIANGIFGKSSTTVSTKLTDSGIYFADQLLGTAIDEIYGSMYQTIQKKTTTTTKSWFKSSTTTKKKITTSFEDMSGFTETERQFSLVLKSLYDSVGFAAEALGKNNTLIENQLDNFIVSIGKISLKGLSGSQIQETLTAIFGKIGDQLANATFPELVEFQSIGEGLFTTLTRVATGIEQADYYAKRLGKSFEKISYTDIMNKQGNVGFEALYQSIIKTDEAFYGVDNNLTKLIDTLSGTAEELYETYRGLDLLRSSIKFIGVEANALGFSSIRGAGGIEELSGGVSAYLENFLSDSEQLAFQTKLMKDEFEKLNLTMPTSKEGFKNLITSLDMTSESNQELFGRLIILSKGFADVADEAEKLSDETISKITNIQKAFLDLVGLIDTTINNLLGKQTGNNTTEATIFNYLQKRQQVDILLTKGSDLTEVEISNLNSLVSELASMASTIQSGFENNSAITGNLVQDLALIKSKINYSNQFVQNDLATAKSNVLTSLVTGFYNGGYTGDGPTNEIAGVVHKGEYVINSERVNAIGGIEAVKSMVQRESIQNNTTASTPGIEYSNDKSGIINQLKAGQETLVKGFNAMLDKLEDIIDYNNERREQSHSVTVSGSVAIEG